MSPPRTVIVAGGGLAGLAAAVRLAEHGVAVTLLETRKKLGGRATSFLDPRTGRLLDNCQHVVLGCCTNYLDLLRRLGTAGAIRWERRQHWIEPCGRTSVLAPGGLLPAPLHFARSMSGAAFLSFSEKAAIARACLAILRADRARHADETFADFLRRHAQPERAVRRFWSPVVVSACNLDVGRVAASVALHVFQEGFLAHPSAADIGTPAVPLVELYEHAGALITGASAQKSGGGKVILGAGVTRLDATTATTSDARTFRADRVICALPVERVNRVVDPALQAADPRFALLDRFTHSPILGVHLTFDRPVLGVPHAVLVDRPTQWLFRKDPDGRSIHAVISAADAWLDLAEDQIAARVLADLHASLPHSASAAMLSVRAVKEKLATFAPTPGVERLRPHAVPPADRTDGRATPTPSLILAGDYTNTGWPATMEGATRSGYTAAAAALGLPPSALLVPPLPTAPLARLLGLRPDRPTMRTLPPSRSGAQPAPSTPTPACTPTLPKVPSLHPLSGRPSA